MDMVKKKSALDMVEEFHKAYNCPVHTQPIHPEHDRVILRMKLMGEELRELTSAMQEKDMVGVVDGICDLLYVVYGTAHEYGLGPLIKKAFAEVHRSNMSKLDDNGQPIYREDGKVLKGPNFTPPNLLTIIQAHTDSY
jgi:predicted HAD superfamily Cof-like phosphohydrolase